MDDVELAQQREQEDRDRALDADRKRREREQPTATGAIALCMDKCGNMVEEKRIALGLRRCLSCAEVFDIEQQAQRMRGPGRKRYT